MDTRELKKAVRDILGAPCKVKSNGSVKYVSVNFEDFSWDFEVHNGDDDNYIVERLKTMKGSLQIIRDKGYKIIGGYGDYIRILREGLYTEDIYSDSVKEYIELMERNVELFNKIKHIWKGNAPDRFADKNLYTLLSVADEFLEKGYAVEIHDFSVGRSLYVKTDSFKVTVDFDFLYMAYPLVRFGHEILGSSGIEIKGTFIMSLRAQIKVNGKSTKQLMDIADAMKYYGMRNAELYLNGRKFDIYFPFIYDCDNDKLVIIS